jgi:hypothetical protein
MKRLKAKVYSAMVQLYYADCGQQVEVFINEGNKVAITSKDHSRELSKQEALNLATAIKRCLKADDS